MSGDLPITVFGPRGDGARNLGVSLRGVRVSLSPEGSEHQADAETLAVLLLDLDDERLRHETKQRALDNEIAALRVQVRRAESRAAEAEQRATSATVGRRRFFGPVLLAAAHDGRWDGGVWLLDPEKRDRGTGLRFSSLAEVRAMHPELWVVGSTADGILLDAWSQPSTPQNEGPTDSQSVSPGNAVPTKEHQ